MRTLPSGTVTLLMTDIEGSTRLLHELGAERFNEALAEHRRILREAFAAHNGVELRTEGDSFFAAFTSAREAVAAATEAQEALAHTPLRVRIGIHTGEPLQVEHEDGYVGVDVHRAARICAAGHGGQVLLSRATRDLLDEDVELRDLGLHRLKDLTQPQRLYQLLAEGLVHKFPPPETLESGRTNLPMQPTPLIGRQRELADVLALLEREDVRLLTLTGPGGTGKTRVALQAAAKLVDHFPHGVFLVSLAPLSDADLVVPAIAQTLGLRERPGETVVQTLTAHLADKQLLLLLDNFEQVAAAAPAVAALRERTENLKLLVSSRAPLHVSGEREYPVPPLVREEALALFAERAQAVQPSFILNSNRPLVAEICRRLDYLPLAIELAAARIKLLPEKALLDRLSERFKLLTGGARDADDRQRTLRAAIDWSYELLTGDEQCLFARLSVFAGGRTLEAIEAVCNSAGELEVFEAIASLVDKSLLRQSGAAEPRFVMLETVHEYAREKLEESRASALFRCRHAEYFLALAEEAEEGMRGPDQARWNDRLELENDNLRTALAWAIAEGDARVALGIAGAVFRFWFVRGRFEEGLVWLRRALGMGAEKMDALRAKALHGLASLAAWHGEYGEATKAAEESLALSEALHDSPAVARALNDLANAVALTGDLKRAASLYERCRETAGEAGDTRYVAMATSNLGNFAMAMGDETAAALMEEALALARQVGAKEVEAVSVLNLGQLACRAGDYEGARSLVRAGTAVARELGMKELFIAGTLLILAAIADGEGDVARAATLAAAVDFQRESIGLSLGPNERQLHETTLASLAVKLGGREFENVSEEARAMDLEQLLAYALPSDEPEAS